MKLVSFGDSITAGTMTPSALSYPQIVATFKSRTLTNFAVSGAMAADQMDQIYGLIGGYQPVAGNVHTYMIGANDERIYGTDANKLANFQNILSAELYYLASHVIKAADPAWSFSAGWAANAPHTMGMSSHTNGATATVQFDGDVLIAGYIIQDANAGQFSVTVDGVAKGTFNASGAAGAAIHTQNGRTYAPAMLRIAGNGPGPHTAVFKVASPTGQYVYLDWVWDGPSGIPVFQSSITRETAAGYSANGGSDANITTFDNAIQATIDQAMADGLNVTYIDAAANFNPATDALGDGLHPSAIGQAKIAVPFVNQVGF